LELIRVAGKNGHLGASMIAIVAEGNRGRIYIDTDSQDAEVAGSAEPSWAPEDALTYNPRYMAPPLYGMTRHRDLFTGRQLVALTTFSDLVGEGRRQVLNDASDAGLSTDAAAAYADSVATYLALSVDRLAMTGNSLVRWNSVGEKAQHAFGRQALPMVWDYAEPNFLGTSTGAASAAFELAADSIEQLPASVPALVRQRDATAAPNGEKSPLVCTDPPYYDNIGYADLSDFFYVWLRRSLKDVDPDLFSTLLTPKAEELVATPYRFEGSRKNAEEHFESGLSKAFAQLRATESGYPTTVFYAFKQSEEDDEVGGLASTGWETMLTALIDAGFSVVGTWPMRTEMKTRQVAMGTNALASSIVLVCRPRANTGVATRRDFVSALRAELPEALRTLQHGNIAPVDLAQASIGPGMAVFTGFSRVREADDSTMTVRSALALINQVLDEILTEQEGDFDAETRWAVAWFDQHGMDPGPYGEADVLARAKDTATNAMVDAGILASRGGKVRLLGRDEHPSDWDPATDQRLTVWEVTQHLVRTLDESERAASALLRRVGGLGETARELAYRLYVICERKGWAQEALAYNGLVVAWPEIVRLAASESEPIQQSLV
ncbi:MAG TPA: hypothetical protein VJ935_05395, partial [Acidimicrobiia bacterium]|nr:hypothetical protein [Acidimicrobiia bacterium]